MLRTLAMSRALILLVLLGLGLAVPYLIDSSFYVSIVTQVLIFGLFAMSIDLLGGYAGLMPLGHAAILGLAGYSLGYFIATLHAPMLVAVVAALAITLLVTLLFGLMAVRTTGISFSMITLAQGLLIWGLSIKLFWITGAENGMRGINRPDCATLYWSFYYLTFAVVVVCTVLLRLLVRSPFGLTILGLRESESRMQALGYNTTLHKLYVFLISGFFAGISGVLYAWYNNFISPTAVYMTPSAEGVLMTILGGAGTLYGPLIGAAIVVVVKNLWSTIVAAIAPVLLGGVAPLVGLSLADVVKRLSDRWPTLLGLIFVVVILFARDGLLGLGRNALAGRRRRAPRETVARGRAPAAVQATAGRGAATLESVHETTA
ncbi:MAG: branched-chain amino acid ABC transporter permease [Chloroflexi bacterium]|nr:branched-chain amino acid ABC transporter permease [Chloroflexota bacterium]